MRIAPYSELVERLCDQPTDVAKFAYIMVALSNAYEQIEQMEHELSGPSNDKLRDELDSLRGELKEARDERDALQTVHDRTCNTVGCLHKTIKQLRIDMEVQQDTIRTLDNRLLEVTGTKQRHTPETQVILALGAVRWLATRLVQLQTDDLKIQEYTFQRVLDEVVSRFGVLHIDRTSLAESGDLR